MANSDYDRDRYGNQGYGNQGYGNQGYGQGYGQEWRNTGNYRYGEGPFGNWGPGYYGYGQGYGQGQGQGYPSATYGTYGYPGGMYNPSGSNQGYINQGYGTQNWNQTGPYTGMGPQGYQRSDVRIQEDINDRLAQHPYLDARNVNVQVHSGDVTLNGWVNSRHDKRTAEDIAESVMGVKNVDNNLSVQPQHQQQPGWMQSIENAFTPGQAGPSGQQGQQSQQTSSRR